MVILGAAGAGRTIFISSLDQKRKSMNIRRSFSQRSGSDHIAFLNAYCMMRDIVAKEGPEAAKQFAQVATINYDAFKNIQGTTHEIKRILVEAGLISHTSPMDTIQHQLGDPSLNERSSNIPLIKALISSGFPNNLATAVSPHLLKTASGDLHTLIHPYSVKGIRSKPEDSRLIRHKLFTYSNLSKSSDGKNLFLRDVSEISPLTAAFFGGPLRKKSESGPDDRFLDLNEWLPLFVRGRGNAKLLLRYREVLTGVLSATLHDLSNRWRVVQKEAGEGAKETKSEHLADEVSRRLFVDGVVDLLDREAIMSNADLEVSGAATNLVATSPPDFRDLRETIISLPVS